MDVEEVKVEIRVTLMRGHVYAWGGAMKLFSEEWKFPPMTFHG